MLTTSWLPVGLKEIDENAKPHHEPFDRMLICQAKAENMLLITHDSLILDYGESCVVWV